MSMYPIAEFSGNASSETVFTSIPQTFDHLQIWIYGRDENPSSNFDNLYMRFNADFNNNYAWHYLYADGASTSSQSGASLGFMPIGILPSKSLTANVYGPTIIEILDYSSTTKFKTTRSMSGFDANGSGIVTVASGHWRSTSGITQIQIGGQNTGGVFSTSAVCSLYGIHGTAV